MARDRCSPDVPWYGKLPMRAWRGLDTGGIRTLAQLKALSDRDLLNIRGLGDCSLRAIRYYLEDVAKEADMKRSPMEKQLSRAKEMLALNQGDDNATRIAAAITVAIDGLGQVLMVQLTDQVRTPLDNITHELSRIAYQLELLNED